MELECCGFSLLGDGRWQLPAALLVGSALSAALLTLLARSRRRRPDQCRSLDCARCHAGASAARRAAARLAAESGAVAVSARLRQALAVWAARPDGGLLVPGLSERPWWQGVYAADVTALQEAWPSICEEYQAALRRTKDWTVNDTPAGRWRVFWLVNQGVARDVCPDTRQVVNTLQAVMPHTVFSNVCFSVLEPGTHIEPHRGPTNARIRCHLGLEVPPHCSLVVDGEPRRWATGRCLLFDDSYLHWAENCGDGPRAVLMVDLWHPRLQPDERRLLARLLRPDLAS